MNKEQFMVHGKVIKELCDNPELGCMFKEMNSSQWELSYEPKFRLNTRYVINDKYSEFRMALADNKRVEWKANTDTLWSYGGIQKNDEFMQCRDYRVLKKNAMVAGDWVYGPSGSMIRVKEVKTSGVSTENGSWIGSSFLKDYTIWKPQEGEFCAFYQKNVDIYEVSRFKRRDKIGTYITEYNHEFSNIRPLSSISNLNKGL